MKATANRPCTSPRLVELVGPAGVGKSTILSSIPGQDPAVHRGPNLWGLPRWLLLASTLELAPTFLAAALAGQPFKPAEMGQMIRLGALRRAVERAAETGEGAILIDEGPVFALAWFEVFYRASGNRWRDDWRRNAREAWARRLHAVVRMDAPDAELARRIRERAKEHMVKDRSDREIRDFMTRFRAAYDDVLAGMAAHGALRIGEVPSCGTPADDLQRVDQAIHEVCDGN
jgi:hypothetical protein